MISDPAPSARRDPQAWIRWIGERARYEMPALLQEEKQRLKPITLVKVASLATTTTTPIPEAARRPQTEPMRRVDTDAIARLEKETAIIPRIKLIDVRDTRELVETAIEWFYENQGCIATVVALDPIRLLGIAPAKRNSFLVNCWGIGCYAVQVIEGRQSMTDLVWLRGVDTCGGMAENFYL